MATSAREALALRALEPHQETELEDDRPRQVPATRRAEACRTEKSTSVVLCARFESGSYLAISLEALAPDIFNIYEGRDASETSALQGAIREAMKSIRESDPTAIASPGIAKAPPCTFAHNSPCRLCRSHLQRVKKSMYRESTTNQQQLINNRGSSRSSCGTCLSSSSSCHLGIPTQFLLVQ